MKKAVRVNKKGLWDILKPFFVITVVPVCNRM